MVLFFKKERCLSVRIEFPRLLVAGSLLAGLGAACGTLALRIYREPGPLASETSVVVPRGRLPEVAAALERAGVIRHAGVLRFYGAMTSWLGPVHAAELAFPVRASLAEVLFVLRHGRPLQHLLTIPEGVTASRVGQVLAGASGLSGVLRLPAEGGFLPETYAYERGDAVEAIVRRAHVAMDAMLGQAWHGRSDAVGLRSPQELLVLASMVERETHLAAERPLVAAVFLNRLRLGMRLQSDPTVVYGVSGGGSEVSEGLRRDDLQWKSPYNTYTHIGLPAGPICNPGAASVLAAAHPAASDALYFVADGTGGHVFARSLSEHVRNVARYRLLGH